jgi:hypothetical protein
MDHRNTVEELKGEIKELKLRVRLDKTDTYAEKKLKTLSFYLADKLYFKRLYYLKSSNKFGPHDEKLEKLSDRVDRALKRLG